MTHRRSEASAIRRIAIAVPTTDGLDAAAWQIAWAYRCPHSCQCCIHASLSTTSGPAAPWQCAAASPVWGVGVAAAAGLLLAGTGGPVPSGGAPCGRPPLPARVPPPLRSGGGRGRQAGGASAPFMPKRPAPLRARGGRPARRGARAGRWCGPGGVAGRSWLCGALPGAGPPPAPVVARLGRPGASWAGGPRCCVRRARVPPPGPLRAPPPRGGGSRLVRCCWSAGGCSLAAWCWCAPGPSSCGLVGGCCVGPGAWGCARPAGRAAARESSRHDGGCSPWLDNPKNVK